MTKAEALRRLGEHVARLRRERGLTQEALAERMEVSRNHIADIELGARNTGIWSFLLLAKALDMPASEVLSVFTASVLKALRR
jgi:transcriptional regulator with XRE-family HTH domain